MTARRRLLGRSHSTSTPSWELRASASVSPLVLWLVNSYVIAPVAFEWFRDADPVVQFVAHTFLFGTVLGALLAGRLPAHAESRHRRREPLGV